MKFLQNLIYKFISIRQVLKYLKEYGIVDEIPEIVSIDYFWPGHRIGCFNTNNNKIKGIHFICGHIYVSFNTGDGNPDECFHFKQSFKGFKVIPEYYDITQKDSVYQRAFINSEEVTLVVSAKNRHALLKRYFNYTKLHKEKIHVS